MKHQLSQMTITTILQQMIKITARITLEITQKIINLITIITIPEIIVQIIIVQIIILEIVIQEVIALVVPVVDHLVVVQEAVKETQEIMGLLLEQHHYYQMDHLIQIINL